MTPGVTLGLSYKTSLNTSSTFSPSGEQNIKMFSTQLGIF